MKIQFQFDKAEKGAFGIVNLFHKNAKRAFWKC